MSFNDAVIEELRSMQDIDAISIRTLSRAVRIVRDDIKIFSDDSVMSVADAADLAISLTA